jgi:hypothetical protein
VSVVCLQSGAWTAVTAERDDDGAIVLRSYSRELASRQWHRGPEWAVERIRLDMPADAISRAVDRLVPRSSREMVLAALERAAVSPSVSPNVCSLGLPLVDAATGGRRP